MGTPGDLIQNQNPDVQVGVQRFRSFAALNVMKSRNAGQTVVNDKLESLNRNLTLLPIFCKVFRCS